MRAKIYHLFIFLCFIAWRIEASPPLTALDFYNHGTQLIRTQNWREAAIEFEKASRRISQSEYPTELSANIFYNLGICLRHLAEEEKSPLEETAYAKRADAAFSNAAQSPYAATHLEFKKLAAQQLEASRLQQEKSASKESMSDLAEWMNQFSQSSSPAKELLCRPKSELLEQIEAWLRDRSSPQMEFDLESARTAEIFLKQLENEVKDQKVKPEDFRTPQILWSFIELLKIETLGISTDLQLRLSNENSHSLQNERRLFLATRLKPLQDLLEEKLFQGRDAHAILDGRFPQLMLLWKKGIFLSYHLSHRPKTIQEAGQLFKSLPELKNRKLRWEETVRLNTSVDLEPLEKSNESERLAHLDRNIELRYHPDSRKFRNLWLLSSFQTYATLQNRDEAPFDSQKFSTSQNSDYQKAVREAETHAYRAEGTSSIESRQASSLGDVQEIPEKASRIFSAVIPPEPFSKISSSPAVVQPNEKPKLPSAPTRRQMIESIREKGLNASVNQESRFREKLAHFLIEKILPHLEKISIEEIRHLYEDVIQNEVDLKFIFKLARDRKIQESEIGDFAKATEDPLTQLSVMDEYANLADLTSEKAKENFIHNILGEAFDKMPDEAKNQAWSLIKNILARQGFAIDKVGDLSGLREFFLELLRQQTSQNLKGQSSEETAVKAKALEKLAQDIGLKNDNDEISLNLSAGENGVRENPTPIATYNPSSSLYLRTQATRGIGRLASLPLDKNAPEDPEASRIEDLSDIVTIYQSPTRTGLLKIPSSSKIQLVLANGVDRTDEVKRDPHGGFYYLEDLKNAPVIIQTYRTASATAEEIQLKNEKISRYYTVKNHDLDLKYPSDLVELIESLKGFQKSESLGTTDQRSSRIATAIKDWIQGHLKYSQSKETYEIYENLQNQGRSNRKLSALQALLDTQIGDCDLHNGLLVHILTQEFGIPARLVVGFHSDDGVIRVKNAHGWSEVWLPEMGGWKTMDATSTLNIDQRQTSSGFNFNFKFDFSFWSKNEDPDFDQMQRIRIYSCLKNYIQQNIKATGSLSVLNVTVDSIIQDIEKSCEMGRDRLEKYGVFFGTNLVTTLDSLSEKIDEFILAKKGLQDKSDIEPSELVYGLDFIEFNMGLLRANEARLKTFDPKNLIDRLMRQRILKSDFQIFLAVSEWLPKWIASGRLTPSASKDALSRYYIVWRDTYKGKIPGDRILKSSLQAELERLRNWEREKGHLDSAELEVEIRAFDEIWHMESSMPWKNTESETDPENITRAAEDGLCEILDMTKRWQLQGGSKTDPSAKVANLIASIQNLLPHEHFHFDRIKDETGVPTSLRLRLDSYSKALSPRLLRKIYEAGKDFFFVPAIISSGYVIEDLALLLSQQEPEVLYEFFDEVLHSLSQPKSPTNSGFAIAFMPLAPPALQNPSGGPVIFAGDILTIEYLAQNLSTQQIVSLLKNSEKNTPLHLINIQGPISLQKILGLLALKRFDLSQEDRLYILETISVWASNDQALESAFEYSAKLGMTLNHFLFLHHHENSQIQSEMHYLKYLESLEENKEYRIWGWPTPERATQSSAQSILGFSEMQILGFSEMQNYSLIRAPLAKKGEGSAIFGYDNIRISDSFKNSIIQSGLPVSEIGFGHKIGPIGLPMQYDEVSKISSVLKELYSWRTTDLQTYIESKTKTFNPDPLTGQEVADLSRKIQLISKEDALEAENQTPLSFSEWQKTFTPAGLTEEDLLWANLIQIQDPEKMRTLFKAYLNGMAFNDPFRKLSQIRRRLLAALKAFPDRPSLRSAAAVFLQTPRSDGPHLKGAEVYGALADLELLSFLNSEDRGMANSTWNYSIVVFTELLAQISNWDSDFKERIYVYAIESLRKLEKSYEGDRSLSKEKYMVDEEFLRLIQIRESLLKFSKNPLVDEEEILNDRDRWLKNRAADFANRSPSDTEKRSLVSEAITQIEQAGHIWNLKQKGVSTQDSFSRHQEELHLEKWKFALKLLTELETEDRDPSRLQQIQSQIRGLFENLKTSDDHHKIARDIQEVTKDFLKKLSPADRKTFAHEIFIHIQNPENFYTRSWQEKMLQEIFSQLAPIDRKSLLQSLWVQEKLTGSQKNSRVGLLLKLALQKDIYSSLDDFTKNEVGELSEFRGSVLKTLAEAFSWKSSKALPVLDLHLEQIVDGHHPELNETPWKLSASQMLSENERLQIISSAIARGLLGLQAVFDFVKPEALQAADLPSNDCERIREDLVAGLASASMIRADQRQILDLKTQKPVEYSFPVGFWRMDFEGQMAWIEKEQPPLALDLLKALNSYLAQPEFQIRPYITRYGDIHDRKDW